MSEISSINRDDLPFLLKQISHPPEKLYIKGNLPEENTICLCIVGARKNSLYGEEVCKKLISGLCGYDICIVSGMATGIDSIAHRTSLEYGLKTIAFPGSGLGENVLYPSQNHRLAKEIIDSGGAIISEFEIDQEAQLWTFPKRNRLMAGISKATIVVEAELKSGTLITSKYATEYNREVGAVPGQITSSLSQGPNMLIDLGAKIIRSSEDILEMLNVKVEERGPNKLLDLFGPNTLNNEQKKILQILNRESLNIEQIILESHYSAAHISGLLSSLEILGLIKEGIDGRFRLIQ